LHSGGGGETCRKEIIWKTRCTWDIAVKMDLMEIGGMQTGFIWLRLRDRWRDFVNTTTIFQVLENAENFLDPLKADSHIACRAHAVPLPCRAAKGLECVFPI
jgi:hypothetical protein